MKKQKGFTLIEVMIIFAIIGILLTVAIPMCAEFNKRQNAYEELNTKKDYKGRGRGGNSTKPIKKEESYDKEVWWVHPETGYKCLLSSLECNTLREAYLNRVGD
jgi:prepilin-type N-terminal cleavage/methylation domain-containing protein